VLDVILSARVTGVLVLVPVRGVSVSVVGPCDRCVGVGTCDRCVSVGYQAM